MESTSPVKLGLIVNPISGMGGSVGLKGTDGKEVLQKAISLGAKPKAEERTKEFLYELRGLRSKIIIVCGPGHMGENIANTMDFKTETINIDNGNKSRDISKADIYSTSSEDTKFVAKKMVEMDLSLIIFVGGDGTARDVLEVVNQKTPCLGVPAGVKIHSSVFAINPKKAGQLTLQYLWGEAPLKEAEVLDIDEERFRNNRVVSKLYGYMLIPYSPIYTQAAKMGSPQTQDDEDNKAGIAKWIIEEMKEDVVYFIGPGTTTKSICDELGLEKTLLGVDVLYNGKIIEKDLNEEKILETLKKFNTHKKKIIVTPIGAQGFIFGRGNLQFSPEVLKEIGAKNIIIICTKSKLKSLPKETLYIDTRDPQVDELFKGMYRVLVDYGEYRILKVE